MSAKPVVLITGCSAGGIGFHLCLAFAERGCSVWAAGRNIAKMKGLPLSVNTILLDVNSEQSIKVGVQEIIAKEGKIDVLVNNAGQGCVAPLVEVDLAMLRQTFDVNVFAVVAMAQAVAPHMIKQRSGTIVNIGSIVAFVPTPWAGVYCASKAAVQSLSDVLRMELQGFGVSVLCVAPGAIKSGIGAANDMRPILKPGSLYSNVESYVRSRGSWSQTPYSTPTSVLATTIVNAALSSSPPRNLATGYRSTSAVLSYYLPTSLKEFFWGRGFGIGQVGRTEEHL